MRPCVGLAAGLIQYSTGRKRLLASGDIPPNQRPTVFDRSIALELPPL
ncbi:MAG: hypothetical protein JWQ43_551 [Glaciihabitans sp.]|nr:hypothetical protein [Glaciihabitans sp.]